MKYWLLLCNPKKWDQTMFVNEKLRNLNIFAWTTGKRSFEDIEVGDKGLVKVGNDNRNERERTLPTGEIVDKLEPGIYAVVEFIEINGKVRFEDNYGIERVNFRVIHNIFHNPLEKTLTRALLGDYFRSYSSCEIDQNTFDSVLNEIEG